MPQSTNFHLTQENLTELSDYLRKQGWLNEGETLNDATIPGAGNMNFTLRLHTSHRTFIVKQARPYVEKYPQVPAPVERAMIEGLFYELTQQHEILKTFTPQLLGKDTENHLLMMEDLGYASDFTYLYKKGETVSKSELSSLMQYLSVLHQHFNTDHIEPSIENRQMRALNAEHIFHYPLLEENGFDLDTILAGLQPIALVYKKDNYLKQKAEALSKFYTNNGTTLLHGDYYPGSWLKTPKGVKVIDPEFCFFGPPEFDLSIVISHLKMTQQDEHLIEYVKNEYNLFQQLDKNLLNSFIGIEMIRRIIGLAQLPLDMDLSERKALLEEAYELIN